MKKTIMIWNRKGGVGKTTITYLLAHYLAAVGRRVLVVDGDPQRNMTSRFVRLYGLDRGLFKSRNIVSVMLEQAQVRDCIFGIEGAGLQPGSLFLLPGSYDLSEVQATTARLAVSDVLDPLEDEYEFILIDGGPNFSGFTGSCLWAADLVILPTFVAMDELEQTVWSYEKAGKYSEAPRRVLLNKFDQNRSNQVQRQELDLILPKFKGDVYECTVPNKETLIHNHYATGEKLNVHAASKRDFVEGFGMLIDEVVGLKERAEVF